MADRCYVGTRKGLFTLERGRRGTWNQVGAAFLGDPVTMVLPPPPGAGDAPLYAALNLGHFGVKLHRSRDGGQRWEEVAAPAYPPAPEGAAGADAPSVSLIWCLEHARPGAPEDLWAGTIPGGLFRSRDGGESWQLNAALWEHPERAGWGGGGYDHPGIHSLCVRPDDPRHLTAAVSTGGVWVSTDDGARWEVRTEGMYAEYMPPENRHDPIAQDAHRVVACPARPDALWCQHHNGVFRSTDAGRHWQDVTAIVPSKFGFAVAVHPRDPDTAWFVPAIKDETRIPVDGKLVVARTRDGGRSFQALSAGLPAPPAYDLIYRHALDVDASGDGLAMGSTTGALWSSADGGESWRLHNAHLPPIYCVRFGG